MPSSKSHPSWWPWGHGTFRVFPPWGRPGTGPYTKGGTPICDASPLALQGCRLYNQARQSSYGPPSPSARAIHTRQHRLPALCGGLATGMVWMIDLTVSPLVQPACGPPVTHQSVQLFP